MDMASFNNQHVMNSMDEQVDDGFFDIKPFLSEVFPVLSYGNSNSMPVQIPQTCMNQQVKRLNDTDSSSLYPATELCQRKASTAISSSQLISFGKSSPYTSDSENYCGNYAHRTPTIIMNMNFSSFINNPSDDNDFHASEDDIVYSRTNPVKRTPIQAQYHIEAERKRREKLSDLFIALSKVVPGLKKLDKASVLGDAIRHIKELQERMKILEEETKKNSTTTHDTMVERCIISTCNDDIPSFREDFNGATNEQNPDIKVKIEGKNVLIKMLCEKNYYGSISSMSSELEKLHLTILDTRILKFGCSTLDITLKAQMDSEFSITVKDIIEHLQLAIFQLHS